MFPGTRRVYTPEEIIKNFVSQHVTAILESLRPLLVTHIIQAFKDGQEFEQKQEEAKVKNNARAPHS